MAKSATIIGFEVELADIDRNIYQTLEFKVAQHPSENAERVALRVLARAIAHEERLEFGKGLSTTEEPALWSKDLQGQILLWIDVGAPSAARLHTASKQARRVAVFTDRDERNLRKEWGKQTIHRAEQIEVVQINSGVVKGLAETIARQNHWGITLNDGGLSVVVDDHCFDTQPKHFTPAPTQ